MSLFDLAAQDDNLRRVTGAIGGAVMDFARERGVGGTFRAQELRDYVGSRSLVAPASPDRILRQLREQGRVGYRVLDRRGSLYEITALKS